MLVVHHMVRPPVALVVLVALVDCPPGAALPVAALTSPGTAPTGGAESAATLSPVITTAAAKRMARAPWNFGGGPLIKQLLPHHPIQV